MRAIKAVSVLVSGLVASAAMAQDLGTKAPAQSQPIAIVHATIHTVEGPTIAKGFVTFDQGVITGVGEGEYTLAGPGVVIDATGKHVYPGLIGAVTRLGLDEISAVRASQDHNEVGDMTPEVYAAVSVNPDSTLLPVTRSTGVLTAGVFPSGGSVPGRVSVMRLDGWTWEEMALKADAGLVVNWPQSRAIQAWWMDQSEERQTEGIGRARRALEGLFDRAAAYHAGSRKPADLGLDAMQLVVGPTPVNPVFIFAQDVDQITSAVTFGAERGLRVVIVGGQHAPLCADLLKSNGVGVIVNGIHAFPRRADAPYDDAFTLPKRLEDAGVRWCMASGQETPHERSLPYVAATAVAYGLSEEAAIRSITLSAAELLGVEERIGSIRPGKSATLIITDQSPLLIQSRVERAFIDGRDVDLSNKHEVLDKKYREKYRQGAEAR